MNEQNEIQVDQNNMYFYQGTEELFLKNKLDDNNKKLSFLKQKITDFLNIKNIHFLFGAGVSSKSIPTMKQFVSLIIKKIKQEDEKLKFLKLFAKLLKYQKSNLEDILGVLYSKREYQKGIKEEDLDTEKLIKIIESTIFEGINVDISDNSHENTIKLYETFYQRTAYRSKDFSRINIFTTNNDLFNERVLDRLNINFNNGFGGGLDKYFNPARFSYTFSKKIEASIEKYEPLDNMVYLYKLHGSINWIEEEGNSLFNIKEINIDKDYKPDSKNVLIYPNPLKQGKSLTAPYSDIIREFQRKLLLQNSVLFVIGYSFSDDHLNNIIYQALSSNSSLSIVIFGNYPSKSIFKINDKRIYKINGQDAQDNKIHYFEYIVNELIPNLNEDKSEEILKNFVNTLNIERRREETQS
ncbi:SIR2 family protein [Aliarcobacter butzleri]|uniref:SIR2 family protein n=1 Tax=Aliarcobacter butzleri TaxID=28197 RepID=UPI00263F0E50|nr:SIR2 family protein [Aliarcobacter butzleri]MDN5046056.1 SIR2 family protein [Aliarcobacter butzleri]